MAKNAIEAGPQEAYIPCPCNPAFHRRPVAVQIHRGPKTFFVKCVCGFRGYFPPGWTRDHGLTEKQAVNRGLFVLTSTLYPKDKDKKD